MVGTRNTTTTTTRARGSTKLKNPYIKISQAMHECADYFEQLPWNPSGAMLTQSAGTGTRGGTSAQHAKAGRAGAKARRSNAGLHAQS